MAPWNINNEKLQAGMICKICTLSLKTVGWQRQANRWQWHVETIVYTKRVLILIFCLKNENTPALTRLALPAPSSNCASAFVCSANSPVGSAQPSSHKPRHTDRRTGPRTLTLPEVIKCEVRLGPPPPISGTNWPTFAIQQPWPCNYKVNTINDSFLLQSIVLSKQILITAV